MVLVMPLTQIDIPQDKHAIVSAAAALCGRSLRQYVAEAAVREAERTIRKSSGGEMYEVKTDVVNGKFIRKSRRIEQNKKENKP